MSKKKTSEKNEEELIQEESSPELEIDYKLLWQRSMADQENSRKRQEQDKANFAQYALIGFVEDLLPVVDNFYRATEHIPEEQRSLPWVTGIQYIQKQLLDALEARGVTEISTKVGDWLNTQLHEVVEAEEAEEYEDDQIIEIKNKGYLVEDLKDECKIRKISK